MKKFKILFVMLLAFAVLAGCSRADSGKDNTSDGSEYSTEAETREATSEIESKEVPETTSQENKGGDGLAYIDNERMQTVGGNIHYHDSLLEYKTPPQLLEETMKRLELLSSYLKETNPEVELIVDNINYLEDTIMFNCYQYYDGVTISSVYDVYEVDENGVRADMLWQGTVYINNGIIEDRDILNIEDFYDLAIAKFTENKGKIVPHEPFTELPISANTVYMEGTYFFYFTSVNGSYIKVDASTGELVDEYYFDGIYY